MGFQNGGDGLKTALGGSILAFPALAHLLAKMLVLSQAVRREVGWINCTRKAPDWLRLATKQARQSLATAQNPEPASSFKSFSKFLSFAFNLMLLPFFLFPPIHIRLQLHIPLFDRAWLELVRGPGGRWMTDDPSLLMYSEPGIPPCWMKPPKNRVTGVPQLPVTQFDQTW